jgi:outer membrane protein
MVRYLLPCILLLFTYTNSFAQNDKVWTLNDCLEYAKENNITVKQVNLTIESAQARTVQSWANLAPSINANASHSWNYGLSFDPSSGILQNQGYQTSSYGSTANLLIFNGLNNYYTIMANQYAQKAATFDFAQAINDLQLNVAQLYLQALFAEERLLVLVQQRDALQQQVDRSQLLYDAGVITKGDYLLAQSSLATQIVNVTIGENLVATSKLSLIQSLNLNQLDIQIEKPDFSNVQITEFKEEASLEGIFTYALQNTPIIKSKEATVWKFKRNLAATRGLYYPSLNFSFTLSTAFSQLRKQNPFDPNSPVIPYTDQLNQNFGQTLSFRLTVPIFNALSTRTNVRLAKIQWLNSQLDLQNEKYKLRSTLQKAYVDARSAYKTYMANQLNLTALEEAYLYAKDKFDVGVINSVTFNDASTKYFNAKTELLLSQYDYILKTKVLDFYQGKQLQF